MPARFDDIRKDFVNSKAVAASRPLMIVSIIPMSMQIATSDWKSSECFGTAKVLGRHNQWNTKTNTESIPRRVVPSCDGTTSKSHLCQTDTFPLTTRYTSYKVVSDFRIIGMRQAKNSHDDLRNLLGIGLSINIERALLRCSSFGRKLQSLANRKMREVLINFLVVDHLAFELFQHRLLRNAVVMDHRVLAHLQALEFSGDGFQESRTWQ